MTFHTRKNVKYTTNIHLFLLCDFSSMSLNVSYLQFISVCSTSTNWASVGSRRSSGGALANIGPAGSRPRVDQVKHLVYQINWTSFANWRRYNWFCFIGFSEFHLWFCLPVLPTLHQWIRPRVHPSWPQSDGWIQEMLPLSENNTILIKLVDITD